MATNWRNRLAGVLEWLLVILFVRGGIGVLTTERALYLPGWLSYLVGDVAIYIYGFAFLATGLALAAGKLFKRKKLHKHALLAMFLTCCYIMPLSIMVHGGFVWAQLQTVLAGVLSAYLWLRWKFQTEYLDPSVFASDIEDFQNDERY